MSMTPEQKAELREAAESAVITWTKFLFMPDDVDLGLALSLDELTLIDNHNAKANPVAILSMLAERDADKAENASLRQRVAELERQLIAPLPIGELIQRLSDQTGEDWSAKYLEARTVSVKLPKPHAHLIWIQAGSGPDDYWDDVDVSHSKEDRCCDGSERYPVYSIFEIQEACAAAGINLEVGE